MPGGAGGPRRRRPRPADLLAALAALARSAVALARGATGPGPARGGERARGGWNWDQMDRHRDKEHVTHDGRGEECGQEQRPGWMEPDSGDSVACGGFCGVPGYRQGNT